ncbi:hypothetical protein C8R46DRAFT_1212594 [Mycena filopes]|nr:hypothetical protein C8R46DRAFT_1212594 [Mycena filopes]
MKDITSQVLSLASIILIPFIPNDVLRGIMFVLIPLFFAARLVHHNMPHRWVETLEVSATDTNCLFNTAMDECSSDPRFVCETGLKLTEFDYALSTLRTNIISMKQIPWTECLYRIVNIVRAIDACRRDIKDLRVSILVSMPVTAVRRLTVDAGSLR